VTDSRIAWTARRNAQTRGSPLLVDGLLYMINTGGSLLCFDARIGGMTSASQLHASGRIDCFDEEGKTTVAKPGRTYAELAVNHLDDGFMASPAVAGRALFLRTRSHLYRVEE